MLDSIIKFLILNDFYKRLLHVVKKVSVAFDKVFSAILSFRPKGEIFESNSTKIGNILIAAICEDFSLVEMRNYLYKTKKPKQKFRFFYWSLEFLY